MNYKIKIGISFIGGTTLGGLLTYFFISEKYKKIAQEEIASVKSVYKRERNKHIKNEVSAKEENVPVESNNPLTFTSKKEAVPYHQMIKKDEQEELEEVTEDMIDELYRKGYQLTEERNAPNPTPYIITEDEFTSDKLHFSKEYLIYYDKDDMVVDDDEEVIEDINSILGYGTLEKLNSSANVIHVRNERLGVDYEVERTTDRYFRIDD